MSELRKYKIKHTVISLTGDLAFGYGDSILAEVAPNSKCLSIEQGDICTVVGPNGCGKTTLLNVISGLKAPARGSVTGFGTRYSDFQPGLDALPGSVLSMSQLRRTFQVPVVSDELPVSDYVMIGCRDWERESLRSYLSSLFQVRANKQANKSGKEEAEKVRSILKALQFESTMIAGEALSYGQRRLASFAQALASGAQLLLLDEATANISDKIVEAMKTLLREYVKIGGGGIGRAILLVEHNESRIEDIVTVRWSMKNGLIRAERLREPWLTA